jgi:hypothetical protein
MVVILVDCIANRHVAGITSALASVPHLFCPSLMTERDHFRFMVGQGLRKGLASIRLRKALTEEEQRRVAETIVHELERTIERSAQASVGDHQASARH